MSDDKPKTLQELIKAVEDIDLEVPSNYPDEFAVTLDDPTIEERARAAYLVAKDSAIAAGNAVKEGANTVVDKATEYYQSGKLQQHYDQGKGYAARGVEAVTEAGKKVSGYFRGLLNREKKKDE